jgi:hypothetical protein
VLAPLGFAQGNSSSLRGFPPAPNPPGLPLNYTATVAEETCAGVLSRARAGAGGAGTRAGGHAGAGQWRADMARELAVCPHWPV